MHGMPRGIRLAFERYSSLRFPGERMQRMPPGPWRCRKKSPPEEQRHPMPPLPSFPGSERRGRTPGVRFVPKTVRRKISPPVHDLPPGTPEERDRGFIRSEMPNLPSFLRTERGQRDGSPSGRAGMPVLPLLPCGYRERRERIPGKGHASGDAVRNLPSTKCCLLRIHREGKSDPCHQGEGRGRGFMLPVPSVSRGRTGNPAPCIRETVFLPRLSRKAEHDRRDRGDRPVASRIRESGERTACQNRPGEKYSPWSSRRDRVSHMPLRSPVNPPDIAPRPGV